MELNEPGRWELKMEVLQAAGFRCEKCKRRHRLTIDHIVPRVMGGGNHRGNLQCLCKRCNKEKGATIWAPAVTLKNAA
jgi:5-methylcytosine-specific restriction endonuclease McrA